MLKILAFVVISVLPLAAQILTGYLTSASGLVMQYEPLSILLWVPLAYFMVSSQLMLERLFIVVMVVFPVIGNANAVASVSKYGAYYDTRLADANFYYAIASAAMALGLRLGIRLFCKRIEATEKFESVKFEPPNGIFIFGLAVFPLIWIVDQVRAVGVPLLSGGSIVDDMYTINYGALYGLGVYLVVAGLYLLLLIDRAFTTTLAKLLGCFALLCLCFFMVFDGRRVYLLVFLLSACVLAANGCLWRGRLNGWLMLKVGGAVLLVYVAVLYLRQGGTISTSKQGYISYLTTVGVEYRDYSFANTVFRVGGIPGYEWLSSTLGAGTSGVLLALFGLSKSQFVGSGSAYSLAAAMHSSFGIRIGLLPELIMAYGWYSIPVGFVLGFLQAIAVRMIQKVTSAVSLAIGASAIATLILGQVGQSTVTAGYLSLYLYLWLSWRILKHIGEKLKGPELARGHAQ